MDFLYDKFLDLNISIRFSFFHENMARRFKSKIFGKYRKKRGKTNDLLSKNNNEALSG